MMWAVGAKPGHFLDNCFLVRYLGTFRYLCLSVILISMYDYQTKTKQAPSLDQYPQATDD